MEPAHTPILARTHLFVLRPTMPRSTARVQTMASSPTNHGVTSTADRLEAEHSALHDYKTRLDKLRVEHAEVIATLRALESKVSQTRDAALLKDLRGDLVALPAAARELSGKIKELEKRAHELEDLNMRTARRYQWEKMGLIPGPSSIPSLGIPKTAQASRSQPEHWAGVQHQRR